jgi:hypothetical protein
VLRGEFLQWTHDWFYSRRKHFSRSIGGGYGDENAYANKDTYTYTNAYANANPYKNTNANTHKNPYPYFHFHPFKNAN